MSWSPYSPSGPHTAPIPPAVHPAPPTVVRVHRPRPAERSCLQVLTGLGLMGSILFCIAIAAGLGMFYGYFQMTDRIVPGVQLGSLDLGGMLLEEAYTAVQTASTPTDSILITDGILSASVSPAQLGIETDVISTVVAAHAVGREGSLLDNAGQMGTAILEGWTIQPRMHLNTAAAAATLESLRPSLSRPAQDASLKLENGVLLPIPGQPGYTLDVEATLAGFTADPDRALKEKTITAVNRPVQPQVTDVGPALAQAQRLLDTSIAISAYDPITGEYFNWPVPRDAVAAWIAVHPSSAGPQVSFDPSRIDSYLNRLGESLGPERYIEAEQDSPDLAAVIAAGQQPAWVRIRHRPTSYVVQPGDTLLEIGWNLGIPYWRIEKANPGIDPNRLLTGTELIIPSKDDQLPLAPVFNKRIVISISDQRLWAYGDGKLIHEYVISTGMDRSPTQPGVFQVQTHDPNAYASIWDLWMPNWLGIYEAWPGFMNGIHGLPLLSNGRRLWAGSLGRPASYGCIILDLPAAEWLYNWAENGVVVEIKP